MFSPLKSTSCLGASLPLCTAGLTTVNVKNYNMSNITPSLGIELVTSFPFIVSVFQQVLTELAFVHFTY